MFELIINLFSYTKLFFSLCFFTYLYKCFYDVCNEKKLIKVKNEKSKRVIKIRNTMSFIYFFLVGFLYIVLDWFSIFSIFLILAMTFLVLMQKFNKSFTDGTKNLDSKPIVQKTWYVFSIIINFVFKIFSPCHRVMDRKINKNKELLKSTLINGIFNNMTNFDISNVFNTVDIPNNYPSLLHYNTNTILDPTLRELTTNTQKNTASGNNTVSLYNSDTIPDIALREMTEIEEFLKNINKKNM